MKQLWYPQMAVLCVTAVIFCSGFYYKETNPTRFTGCSAAFTDLGDSRSGYQAYRSGYDYLWTFCPEDPLQQVVALQFETLDILSGDLLEVFDGENAQSGKLLLSHLRSAPSGLFSGLPGPAYTPEQTGPDWIAASPTNLSGCITVHFRKNRNHPNEKGGWRFSTDCRPRSLIFSEGSQHIRKDGFTGEDPYWILPVIMLGQRMAFLQFEIQKIQKGAVQNNFQRLTYLADGKDINPEFEKGEFTIFGKVIGWDLNNSGALESGETLEELVQDPLVRQIYQERLRYQANAHILE